MADDPSLPAPRTQAVGLKVENWEDRPDPRLNGQPLALKPYEWARSLAVAADGRDFVLGTEWWLRRYDRAGSLVWQQAVPGVVWAVNLSADGRFVVAAYGAGTLRWHRFSDGQEILALFPHADQQRWIAWTPEGFYASSGPQADELFGYHVNRGADQAGEFISAAQLKEKFFQPGLIARLLDPEGDALMREAVAQLGDVQQILAGAGARLPEVELVATEPSADGESVTLRYKVRDTGGGIGGVRFYVDGVPEEGRQAGGPGDGTESRTFRRAPGSRRIEVAARNQALVEGPRQGFVHEFKGAAVEAGLHILAVGVSRYQDGRLNLKHGAADAEALAKELAERARPLFKRGVAAPTVLTDRAATLQGIETAYAGLRAKMKPEDTLVLFLAGHGEAPVDRGYTFLPWDFQRGAANQGLDEARLRKMLESWSGQVLVLLDTCEAGAMATSLDAGIDRLVHMNRKAVIGASRRGETAQEGFEGHGVFTAALLRLLNSKAEDEMERDVKVTSLRVDVEREVNRILRKMGASTRQRVSGYLGSADFPVWRKR